MAENESVTADDAQEAVEDVARILDAIGNDQLSETITQGSLLEAHVGRGPTDNPFRVAFRPREYGGTEVKRGYMTQSNDPASEDYDPDLQGVILRFMYNPTTIDYGYQTSSTKPFHLLSEDERAANLIVDGHYVSFQLVFDRTREFGLGLGPGVGGQVDTVDEPFKPKGSLQDIEVFQRLVGYYRDGSITGPMVKVVFSPGFWVRGYITVASIKHGLFSSDMTPMVSMLSVTVQTLFDDEGGSPDQLVGATTRAYDDDTSSSDSGPSSTVSKYADSFVDRFF